MVFSGCAGVALGVVFAVGVAEVNPEFRPLAASPWIVSLFSLGVGLTAAAAVLDVALLALLRSDLQFARTAVFALVKLGLIVAAGIALVDSAQHVTIIATWIAGLLLSLVTLGVYATLKGHVRRIRPLEFEALRNLRGDAIRNHALNLALALPDWSMPILVTAILSAADSGAFFIAWMMAGVAMFIPASLAQSLNAVCARNPELLPTNMRLTLRMSFVAGVVVWLATALVGPFVLGLLGNRYFEAAPALVILALGIFPVTIKVHYTTMGRLEDSLGETTRTTAAGAVVELVLAAAGGMLAGLTGVALGVLIGLILQAIAMTPRIRRGLRTGLRIPGVAASTSGPV